MEATLQPQSLKVTIKLKRDKNVSDSSTTTDHLNNAEEERNVSDSFGPIRTLNTFCEDQENFSSVEGGENHGIVNEGNQTSESSYQLVLYDPDINSAGNRENALNPTECPPPLCRPHPFSDRTPRVLPSRGAFTVQCANCFKWRLIPTKEKYEEIREHILAQPFLCETAREWRPDISCDDPPDITQDGNRLWAIDKPNIAQPPPGWQRLLRIRGEGSTKFADVYYVAPSGKRLRSLLEIQRKRPAPARSALRNDAGDLGIQGYLPPPEVARLTWVSTDVDTDLQLSSPVLANDHLEAPGSKRRRTPSPLSL